jgi:hypothetical protein
MGIHLLVAEGLEDARLQLVLAVGACRVADHAFVVGELAVEQEGIVPVKGGLAWRIGAVHGGPGLGWFLWKAAVRTAA